MESVVFKEALSSDESQKLFPFLERMLECVDSKEPEQRVKFVSLLYEFFYVILSGFQAERKRAAGGYYGINRISPVLAYVEKEFRQKISLGDAAQIINVSPEHLCRLFKKYTDMTFNKYLMSLRISAFYQALQNTNQKISALLEECGIANYKVFIREFKKTFGATPEAIRQRS